jgi:DNA-binding SARP family transcriptional activator
MLTVRLFGKFQLEQSHGVCEAPGGKALELLCYLMLHRHQQHRREALAALLWPDCETSKSKKYLRQVVWQMRTALHAALRHPLYEILSIGADSILMDGDGVLQIDVDTFEKAYQQESPAGKQMSAADAHALHQAVQLYRGDLLEGCYEDWCLLERERLQNSYLSMLEKLIRYCLDQRAYQRGIDYAGRVLRLDRAHERSHQQLMRLHYYNGDRTAALRQFERCRAALREELDVEPSRQTIQLYQEIRAAQHTRQEKTVAETSISSLADAMVRLESLLRVINEFRARVNEEIQTVRGTSGAA